MSDIQKLRRAPVTLTLGDNVERTMKYTLNAFAKMEERYGGIDAAMAAMETGSIIAMRFMIYVGLLYSDKEITEEQVGDLIEMSDLDEVSNVMGRALGMDYVDDADLVKEAPPLGTDNSPNV